jgi:putative transcriptional regulator
MVSGTSLRGKLLVALPPLVDENFDRTVVLLLEHTADGALGVVLNRPGTQPVADVLASWAPLTSLPSVVFGGGPVEPGSVIGLARARIDEPTDHWVPVFDGIGTVDLTVDPGDVQPPLDAVRLFSGYAGWGAEQLEGELAVGAWAVADFVTDDAFGGAPDDLWRAVLGRQQGRLAWLANFPDDPSLN